MLAPNADDMGTDGTGTDRTGTDGTGTDGTGTDDTGTQRSAVRTVHPAWAVVIRSFAFVRKEIVERLVRTLESAHNAASSSNPPDTEAQKKYSIIGGPLIESLQKLTGQNIRQPNEWNTWWNKNKKAKDW